MLLLLLPGLGRRLGELRAGARSRWMWMWRWRQRKRKRAKRREDEGVREGDVERRMGREGEQVGVCPCAGTTDCTVPYRATSRNHPSLLPFSIPYSFDSPSTSTLSSYIRLFHVLLFFFFSSPFFFCLFASPCIFSWRVLPSLSCSLSSRFFVPR